MKCYQVHMLKSQEGSLFKLDEKDELDQTAEFRKAGIYTDLKCVAFNIIEGITRDISTADKLAERFARRLSSHVCPQLVTSRDVLKWMGEQISVSV